MAKPKEPGYYYFDGKRFSQPKFLWRSENIGKLMEYAGQLVDEGSPFRLTVDPNAKEGLAIRPDKKASFLGALATKIGDMVTDFMETCPPLPPGECDPQ